jgi:polyisoprenoid-binding protein YceI
MKKIRTISIIALASSLVAFTPVALSTWTSDTVHSRFGFSINHMGIADFNGSFDTYEIKMTTPNADFTDATVELSGDVASINTGNEMRDNHLETAEFFDAAKYPKFTFKSTSFKKVSEKEYAVKGQLTLHGVTKEVTLKAIANGTVQHPMSKKDVAGFKVTGMFKRSDFALGVRFSSRREKDRTSCFIRQPQFI